MRKASLCLALTLMPLAPTFGQASKRLAIVDAETEFVSDEQRAELLESLRDRFAVQSAAKVISASEIESRLVSKDPLENETKQLRESHEARATEIEKNIEEAKRYYLASQFDEALTILSAALESLNGAVLALGPETVTEILHLSAACYFFNGDESKAKIQLASLLDLDSGAIVDAQRFPPPFVELFNQVKAERRYSWQSLERSSAAKGIRGKLLGFPLNISENNSVNLSLPLKHPIWGTKTVVLEADGFAPLLFAVDLVPSKFEFRPLSGARMSTKGLFKPIGNSTAPVEIKRIASELSADIVLLLQAARESDSQWALQGQLLELQTNVTSPTIDAKAMDMGASIEKLVSGLLDYISYEGRVLPEKNVPPEDIEEIAAAKPVYKTWWFWTLLGAAAVGAGVGGYLVLNQDDSVGVTINRAGQ